MVIALALTAGAMTASAQRVYIYEDGRWFYYDQVDASRSNGVDTANGYPVFEEAERNGGG